MSPLRYIPPAWMALVEARTLYLGPPLGVFRSARLKACSGAEAAAMQSAGSATKREAQRVLSLRSLGDGVQRFLFIHHGVNRLGLIFSVLAFLKTTPYLGVDLVRFFRHASFHFVSAITRCSAWKILLDLLREQSKEFEIAFTC